MTVKTIVSGYGPASDPRADPRDGAEILYGGPIDPPLQHDYVLIKESLQPLMLYQLPIHSARARHPT